MAVFTPPEYFTQAEAEERVSVRAVVQLYDDDGDGAADADAVLWGIREASAHVDTFLYAHFDTATIAQLKQDYRFKGLVIDVFMAIGGERRTEFSQFGSPPPHSEKRKRAMKDLELIGKGLQRLGAEEVHGRNQTKAGRSNRSLPATHIFARSRNNPNGSGGF